MWATSVATFYEYVDDDQGTIGTQYPVVFYKEDSSLFELCYSVVRFYDSSDDGTSTCYNCGGPSVTIT